MTEDIRKGYAGSKPRQIHFRLAQLIRLNARLHVGEQPRSRATEHVREYDLNLGLGQITLALEL
jgi:hypothetical protein